jgi:hypothetical protein
MFILEDVVILPLHHAPAHTTLTVGPEVKAWESYSPVKFRPLVQALQHDGSMSNSCLPSAYK